MVFGLVAEQNVAGSIFTLLWEEPSDKMPHGPEKCVPLPCWEMKHERSLETQSLPFLIHRKHFSGGRKDDASSLSIFLALAGDFLQLKTTNHFNLSIACSDLLIQLAFYQQRSLKSFLCLPAYYIIIQQITRGQMWLGSAEEGEGAVKELCGARWEANWLLWAQGSASQYAIARKVIPRLMLE